MQEEKIKPDSVLVVDDASVMRVTSERVLQRFGYQVTTAVNGEDALTEMGKNPFEVVLLDIKMPGISGVEVLRRIKQNWPATEVVIMTAYADQDIAEESLSLGAGEILIKPVDDINNIVQAITKAMVRAKIRKEGNQLNDHTFEQLLITLGLVSPNDLETAKAHAAQHQTPLRQAAISLKLISDEELDWNIAQFLEIPYLRVYEKMLDLDLIKNFPAAIAQKFICLPLWREDGTMHLVMADPFNAAAIDEIEKEIQMKIKPAKGAEHELARLINKFYGARPGTRDWKEMIAQLKTATPEQARELLAAILGQAKIEQVLEASVSPAETGLYEFRITVLLKPPDKN